VDRQAAPPALRLLDSLLAILDEAGGASDGEEGRAAPLGTGGPALPSAAGAAAAARRRVAARLRAAFGGAGLQEDVVSLAQRLASQGRPVVDELLEDSVDPVAFVEEVGALLARAEGQQRELEAAAAGLAAGGAERAGVEGAMRQRADAIRAVQEVLEVAREVQRERR
jgi:hypothetical protein